MEEKQKRVINKVKTNERRIMVGGVINQRCDRQLEKLALTAEWSLSPWAYWSLVGLMGPHSSDWRWICWEKLLWTTAVISGLGSGSSPSPEWFPPGG